LNQLQALAHLVFFDQRTVVVADIDFLQRDHVDRVLDDRAAHPGEVVHPVLAHRLGNPCLRQALEFGVTGVALDAFFLFLLKLFNRVHGVPRDQSKIQMAFSIATVNINGLPGM
jgi:hypothetical protein